jgi:hypothetical protein
MASNLGSCGPSADKSPLPVVIPEGWRMNMYKPGEPFLSGSMLKTLSIDLQVLHANVVDKPKEGQHGYTAKVIEGYSFVQEFPADKIDLTFNDVIHANIFSVSAVSLELIEALGTLSRYSSPTPAW